MTIDQQAKYLLLDSWCDIHDMPIIYVDENTLYFQDTQDEFEVIHKYCLKCIEELPTEVAEVILLTLKQEDETN